MLTFYGSPDGLRLYAAARALVLPLDADQDEDVIPWLLGASEWLDGRYRSSYAGTKVGQRSQVREWPRYGGMDSNSFPIDSTTIPTEVENATYEAALRIGAGEPLFVNYTPPKYKSASVPGAVSVEYDTSLSALDIQPQFAAIDAILFPVLTGSGSGSSLSGGACRG
jgi:hypothetical protein